MQGESPEMAADIQQPVARTDPPHEVFMGQLLIEIGAGLVGIKEVDRHSQAPDGDGDTGISRAMQDTSALREAFELTHREIIAFDDLVRVEQVAQDADDLRLS